MNWEQIAGKWTQAKGEIKQSWGKLTDDDILNIEGKKDVLVGKLQERYGYLKDEAEKHVDEWVVRVGDVFTKPRAPRERPTAPQDR